MFLPRESCLQARQHKDKFYISTQKTILKKIIIIIIMRPKLFGIWYLALRRVQLYISIQLIWCIA